MKRILPLLLSVLLLLSGCSRQTQPVQPNGTANIDLPCNGFRLTNGAGEDMYMNDKGGCDGSMAVGRYYLLTGSPADISLETPNIPPYTAEFDDPSDDFNAMFVSAPDYCFSVCGEGIENIEIDTDAVTVTGEQMELRIMARVGDGTDFFYFNGAASECLELTVDDGVFRIAGAEGECTMELQGYTPGVPSGKISFTASGGDISADISELMETGRTEVILGFFTRLPWMTGQEE